MNSWGSIAYVFRHLICYYSVKSLKIAELLWKLTIWPKKIADFVKNHRNACYSKNTCNKKVGDYYGEARKWSREAKLKLGTF